MPPDHPPQTLLDELSKRQLIDPGVIPEPLTGGRSNLVWKLPGSGKNRVLKLYRGDQANPLFRNDVNAEIMCLERLSDSGMAPKLGAAGTEAGMGWVLYEHAPGSVWQAETPAVADMLGALHSRELHLDLPKGRNGSAELQAHGNRILDLCGSDYGKRIAAACPKNCIPATEKTALIHGDPVPGNILVQDGRLTLIDWQCPAIGDPCEDIAVFLSPAMMQVYRGHPLTGRETHQFLDAYPDPDVAERYRELASWYHWRMSAYCLWRTEQGHADYAIALDLEFTKLQETMCSW